MTSFVRQVDAAIASHVARGGRVFFEFGRYAIISAVALLADFGLLLFAAEILGFHYLVAGGLGFFVGVVIVYVGSVAWVFEKRNLTNTRAEFVIFAAVGVMGLFLNELILWLGTDVLVLHYSQSKIVAAGFVFLSNFATRKYLLFTETR